MALRCWIDAKEEDLFNLIIQLESKRMVMYELDVKNGAVRQVWGEVGSQI